MNDLHAVIAAVVGMIAVARATRLITSDAYPPARALRVWWWNQTAGKGGWRAGWAMLLVDPDDPEGSGCPFCFAPYAAALDLGWALWAGAPAGGGWGTWAGWWWAVNVWAAGSYLAAMLVARDEPPAEE